LGDAKITFEVNGLNELMQELEKAGDKAGELLEAAALAGGKVVEEQARENAPREKGTLAKSITTGVVDKGQNMVEVGIGPGKKGWYGRFSEHGTSREPARPWLFPAYEQKKEEAENAIAEVIREGLGL
jgi:HK97 gp10 family phage protein